MTEPFKEAYTKMMKENTQLHAQILSTKQQLVQVSESAERSLKSLDGILSKTQKGLVKALRNQKMTDQQIIDWLAANDVPAFLQIVPDDQDMMKGGA